MRIACLFLLLGTSYTGWGQSMHGKVLNILTDKPIAYVIITNIDRRIAVRSDQNGIFYFPETSDTLRFAAPGFQTTQIVRSQLDTMVIRMAENPLVVENISSGGTRRPTLEQAGTRRKRPQGRFMHCDSTSFSEMALFIPNSDQRRAILHKVYYYVPWGGKQRSPFRVRIYENNNGKPGKDLLDESVVIRPKWWKRWKEARVGPYNISLPKDGFFVSMEWLREEGNYTDRAKMKDGSIRTKQCFGQILGMADEPKEPRGWTRSNGGTWFRWEWPQLYKVYNPMIRVEWLRYQ